jgi:hypothetical protein
MKTLGISPKLTAAVITAVITYLLSQTILELPDIATVIGQALLVALAAYAAPPGKVTPQTRPGTDR